MLSVGRRIALRALPLLALAPTYVAAHEIVPGVTGLASALIHPFMATEIVLVMLGAALLAASSERLRTLGWCCPAMAAGIAMGLALQMPLLVMPGLWRWPIGVALALGLAVASGIRFGQAALFAAVTLAAMAVGLGTPRERPFLAGALEAWAGATLAMLIVLAVLAVPLALMRHPVVRIAARVAGSWIAAIAALGLAFALR